MTIKTSIPHASFGDADCCGCLNGVVRGDQADIIRNECGAVVRRVSAGQLTKYGTKGYTAH